MNYYLYNLKVCFRKKKHFKGWGRKRTGRLACWLAKQCQGKYTLYEDGFIRSLGLGVENSPSFSYIEDDIGIYYDATTSSRLEEILNEYKFESNKILMSTAKEAISYIKKFKVSKYNQATLESPPYLQSKTKKVLIIAQTAGDASLYYGLGDTDNKRMIEDALKENANAEIYLKIHPDVLIGKKSSNIDMDFAKKYCRIITEDINPITLLESFEHVYTQTSQMGFEALLLDKKVSLYGIPFYAGWGLENIELKVLHDGVDKNRRVLIEKVLERRKRKLTFDEIFASAYILYTVYYNPYTKKPSSLIETIVDIVNLREEAKC